MIRIVTDSSSDYIIEDANKLNFEIVPLNIRFNEYSYIDVVELSKDEFYKKLTMLDITPQTSQPSPESFVKLFTEAKENGDEVICLLISSKLSGTLQSATLAKQMVDYEKIHIFDTKQTTIGLRILVKEAVRLRDENHSSSEIIEAIKALSQRVMIRISPDTLDYLHKGGRLSSKERFLGNLLKIKPIIELNDGVVKIFGKSRGVKGACEKMVEDILSCGFDPEYGIYGAFSTELKNTDILGNVLKNKADLDIDELCQIGPVVGTHLGPGSFGLVYVRK